MPIAECWGHPMMPCGAQIWGSALALGVAGVMSTLTAGAAASVPRGWVARQAWFPTERKETALIVFWLAPKCWENFKSGEVSVGGRGQSNV